jgi:hypothetical protein
LSTMGMVIHLEIVKVEKEAEDLVVAVAPG